MSAQNKLNKPTFTKSVMGYTQSEVDKYVDRVSERYNSVCRENAELKRRVLALSLRIDETEAKLEEAQKASKKEIVIDKNSLARVFTMLNDERKRYSCFIDSLMETLNTLADESIYNDNNSDDWIDVLGDFIEEAISTDAAHESCVQDNTSAKSEPEKTNAVEETIDNTEEAPAAVESEGEIPETEEVEEKLEEETKPSVTDSAEQADADTGTEASEEKKDIPPAEEASDKRSPAEITAELDFYSDKVYADGESFDPMTLAASITAQKKRPSLEDFMRPINNDN